MQFCTRVHSAYLTVKHSTKKSKSFIKIFSATHASLSPCSCLKEHNKLSTKRQLPTFLLNSYSGWGFIFFRCCQWLPSDRINYKYTQKEQHINFKWDACISSLWLYTYRFEKQKHATSKLYKNIWSLSTFR